MKTLLVHFGIIHGNHGKPKNKNHIIQKTHCKSPKWNNLIISIKFMLVTLKWRTTWTTIVANDSLQLLLVIILKVKLAHESNLKTIFEGHFTNENIIIFNLFLVKNVSHYHSLWNPLNVLPQKQQNYLMSQLNHVTKKLFSSTMIHFHHSLWNTSLKEGVTSQTLKNNFKSF